MSALPATIANIRVNRQSFEEQCIEGEVSAGDFKWDFTWSFNQGELIVEPSLGRALIIDSLRRYLVQADYKLEPGGDYFFTVRARF